MFRKLVVLMTLALGLSPAAAVMGLSMGAASANQAALPYDELVIAAQGDLASLDPAWDYESVGTEIIQQIYEPLLVLEREKVDTYAPGLATDWHVSPAGDIYTFTIRQGVKFHDGSDLTPGDVAYSLQRGVLQGGYDSPQWLYTEALFGAGVHNVCELIDDSVCDDRAALQARQGTDAALVAAPCLALKDAIQADEENWQVVIHLAQPWGAFLNTLVGSWGSILDQGWTSANGGWDGDCDTWHNYYAGTTLNEIANGSGPFKLDHWTPGSELALTRNEDYWRVSPIWEGGPSGPAALARVTHKVVPTETVRLQMLLDGSADIATLGSTAMAGLEDEILYSYERPDGLEPVLQNLTGTLKVYRGGYSPSATDAFFNYDIQPGGALNYTGSGALDGNGIPADFFNDIHVRKGFNYAFDWKQFNDDLFGGVGIQRSGPIIYGLPGYSADQPTYKNDPALALQELNQAWGGLVATHGFSLTLAYNEGNLSRQRFAELLKAGIEGLDAKFHVTVATLPFGELNTDIRNHHAPIFMGGWIQDIPHAHNWAVPWLTGIYANRQGLPVTLKAVYEAKIDECIQLTGEAARACYEDIQTRTYDDALDIFLVQGRIKTFVRAELQGYYQSLVNGKPLMYYALRKGPLPTGGEAVPGKEGALEFDTALGATGTISIPAGTVASPVRLVLSPDILVTGQPDGFGLGGLSFEILAHDGAGAVIEDLALNHPLHITLHYTQDIIQGLSEDSLRLFWWDGSQWADAACGEYIRDAEGNMLAVDICHLSTFALGGTRRHTLYAPVIMK